jgi:hypothetical protein
MLRLPARRQPDLLGTGGAASTLPEFLNRAFRRPDELDEFLLRHRDAAQKVLEFFVVPIRDADARGTRRRCARYRVCVPEVHRVWRLVHHILRLQVHPELDIARRASQAEYSRFCFWSTTLPRGRWRAGYRSSATAASRAAQKLAAE